MLICWVIIFFIRTSVVQLQDSKLAPIQVVNLGDNVTIQCNLPEKKIITMVWYKQSVGHNPRLVAMVYRYLQDIKFLDKFQNVRFTVLPERRSFHLHITAVTQEDTGTYYCGIVFLNELQFVSWTYLMPAGIATKLENVVEQPELELLHLGHSIRLECTVITRSCSEDHSVYWFKHGSGESYPGIIYTDGTPNSQCIRNSATQSCIYKLPRKKFSLSDAGTYYCAVAMCGEILFGNGTALKIMDTGSNVWDPVVFGFAVTNAITVTVIIALVFHLWNNRRKKCEDDLNYAAVTFIPTHSVSRKARKINIKEKSEYAEVAYSSTDQSTF